MKKRRMIYISLTMNALYRIKPYFFPLTLFLILLSLQVNSYAIVSWKKHIWISEQLKIYDFPEELLSYTIHFPENTVEAEHLKLTREGEEQPVVYQLTDVREKNGYLSEATIHFRTGLNKGETVRFCLEHDTGYLSDFPENISIHNNQDGTASVIANQQFVTVPYGKYESEELRTSEVMPPIIELGVNPQNIAAKGKIQQGGNCAILLLTGEVMENGPLFCDYRVSYHFAGGGSYQVNLKIQHDEKHVLINEYMDKLKSENPIHLQLDYTEGVDPNGRLAYTMSGYGRLSGPYNKNPGADGSLPFYLGLWDVHNNDVPYSVAFWNDSGKPSNAILFSQYKHDEWEADTHYIWSVENAPEQLHFYDIEGRKFMQAQVAGKERHWAVSVIPREEIIIEGNSTTEVASRKVPGKRTYKVYSDFEGHGQEAYPLGKRREFGAGPEVRLHQKLTYFSLNWIKDMVFEFREPLSKYEPEGEEYTYDEYWHEGKNQGSWFFKKTVKTIAEMGLARNGRAQFRTGDIFRDYGNSRAQWTQEQRDHIRALLIWATHIEESDIMYPHKTLMGGHPNFIANAKYGMAYSCALFPEHPTSPEWKKEYMNFLDTFFEDYIRDGVPEMGINEGRFMENPANYMPASLLRIYQGANAIKKYDGTYLLSDQRFRSWMQWLLHALMPYVDGGKSIMPSPIGAHAVISRWDTLDNGEDHLGAVYETAKFMDTHGDKLGADILFVLTHGKEGEKPQRNSGVWADYGGVLHYAAESDDHAFVHLFQRGSTTGFGNYRYPPHNAGGAIYYAAKGKTWSWNGAEKYGDAFNPNRNSFFRTRKGYLGGLESAGQHGELYNFGDIQYYKAIGNSEGIENGYLSRGIMMIRDDFIAVYDDVDKSDREGIFQWINEEDGLILSVYSDRQFQNKVKSKIVNDRFLTDREWNDGAPVEGMKKDNFSVRWEGAIRSAIGLSGDYTFSVDINEDSDDLVRLYIDNNLVLETTGRDAEETYRLEDSLYHPFKLEYIHGEGEAGIKFRFSHQEDKNTSYQARGYTVLHELPDIHSVKGKLNKWARGDQLHVAAPANAPVKSESMEHGAIVEGAYIFISDDPIQYEKEGILFEGSSGYVHDNQIAVFEGSRAGYNNLILETVGGNFGASAHIEDSQVTGRISGASGGVFLLTVPADFDTTGKQVRINGQIVDFELDGHTYRIQADISHKDGYKKYRIANY